ncbi:MAG TPA: DUF3090 domain-containing protein [Mycobacteriales bacterium]|nr:DUF3090 domain-containing protein [Mycobacteriales bacterium]
MAGQEHSFDPPDRFVAGTVGEPGERTFYLQASGAGRTISVSLEKVQVAALAERLDQLLDELLRREGAGSDIPAVAARELTDVAPLEVPIAEEFRVGTLGLTWDPEDRRVVIEASSLDASGEVPADPDVLRVRIGPGPARAFVQRALRVVSAGRPPCPLCGLPLDATGHVCPRQNGHRG